MKIYKLSAISSTNDYLKEFVSETTLENYTVITTNFQFQGKGQFDNIWHSKKDKNLLFSVLVKINDFKVMQQTYLNFAVSLAIYRALKSVLNDVKIKWPNDIMSRQKKICGILIENIVKNGKIEHSIVGIGLNVNQVDFPTYLKNVTSIKLDTKKETNCDLLLKKIVLSIKEQIKKIENKQFDTLQNDYKSVLYKMNEPTMFKDKNGAIFIGKIINVSKQGKLEIELDDETIRVFEVKEVSFI